MVTRTSSSGNNETKPEWARLAASTPPLSSPYFLMTPNTNADAWWRCCAASTRRIARSIAFIGDEHLSSPLTPALPGSAAGKPPQPAEPPRRLSQRVAKPAGTSARKRPGDPLVAFPAPGEVRPCRRNQQKPQPREDSSPDHSH